MRPVDAKHPVTLGYRQKMKSQPSYIHRGIDFGVPVGTPVKATKGGKVVHAGTGGMGPAFGIHVVLLVDGIYVIYAHLSSEQVSVGQTVVAGQVLGKSGATGNVTGPHLHVGEFTSFSYLADRKPQFIDWQPPKEKPVRKVYPWFNVAFLNTWGNNNTKGAVTFAARDDNMTDDATAGSPAVVGFCEVRSGTQEKALTKEMVSQGYVLAAYSHMLALYVRPHVIVRGVSFAKYKHQKSGTVEGILRAKLTIDGSKNQVGITHLDVKASEAQKRANLKDAYNAMRRFGLATLLPDWKSRTVIMGDFNSSTAIQALTDRGFKDAKAGARIDFIAVGAKRPMRGASKTATESDHPVVRARLAKY